MVRLLPFDRLRVTIKLVKTQKICHGELVESMTPSRALSPLKHNGIRVTPFLSTIRQFQKDKFILAVRDK
jgi:hypothetical protein